MAQLQSTSITGSLIVTGGITGSISISAPGSDTQVLYNSGGVISANSGFVYSGSNIGIGTTSPSTKLDVNGTGKFGASAYIGTGIAQGYYQDVDNGAYRALSGATNPGYFFQKYNGSETTMFVGLDGLYAGRVGIGTTTPAYNLHIAKASSEAGILTSYGASDIYLTHGGWGIGAGKFGIGDGSYPTIAIDTSNDRLGVGITLPTEALAVSGNIETVDPYGKIGFNVGDAYGDYPHYGLGKSNGSNPVNLAGFYGVTFGTYGSERMRIDDSGNVMIGTSTPQFTTAGRTTLTIDGSTTAISSLVIGGTWASYWYADSGGIYLAANGSRSLALQTNGDTRIHITSTGDVGIGTATPSYKLDVNGRTIVNQFQYIKAIDYSSGDLNLLVTAGFYNGSSMSNAPNSGWFWVTIETYSGDYSWIHQTATSFGSGNTANEVYTRVNVGGTWGSWKQLGDAASISGTTNYIPKFTSGTAIGNSVIYENSSKIGISNTDPTQLVDIGVTGTQKSLRVRGTYNFDGAYLGSSTTNGGAKLELVAHTGVSTSSGYRIRNDRDVTPDLTFGYAASTSSYSALSYSELMRLTPDGNLGIGVTSPSKKLVVAGNGTGTALVGDAGFTNYTGISLNGTLDGSNYNILSAPSDPTLFINRPSGNDIRFRENNVNQVTIATGGNVGIGTTTPGYQLEVNGWVGAARYYPYSSNSTYITGDGGGLLITGAGYLYVPASGGSYFEGATRIRGYLSNDIAAYMQINGGTSAHTFINGYLGVGKSSPASRIDTDGSIMSNSGLTNASSRPAISAGTLTNGELRGYSNTSTGADDGFLRVSAGGGTNANTKSYIDISGYSTVADMDRNIVLGTSGAERIRITNGGRVGIGTSTPATQLHIAIDDNSFATSLYLENINAGSSALSSIAFKNASQNAASIYQQNSSGDLGIFNSATTGKISFFTNSTEKMTIDSSGNIGIGTSSPAYTLDVNGDIGARGSIVDPVNNLLQWNPGESFLYAGGYDAINNIQYTPNQGIASISDFSTIQSGWGGNSYYNGQVLANATAGETILRGQLLYLRSNGKWLKADAIGTSTSTPLLGIALDDASLDGSISILLDGIIIMGYHAQTGAAIPGLPLYIATSNVDAQGYITEDAPSVTGEVVRLIGHNLYDTGTGVTIRFQPDNTWIEL